MAAIVGEEVSQRGPACLFCLGRLPQRLRNVAGFSSSGGPESEPTARIQDETGPLLSSDLTFEPFKQEVSNNEELLTFRCFPAAPSFIGK